MTKARRQSGEFTDFEDLKMELSKARSALRVGKEFQEKNKNRYDLPVQYLENERAKIADLEEKSLQLEALLATEPPPPELPPRQPLLKVVGILEEFSVQKVIGYFGVREYDPEAFARKEERNQIGSLLVAMTGNVAGAAVTGQSSIRQSDCSDFVRGKINGIPFYGWLGQTHTRAGDYVEMAVVEQDGFYLVYSIMLPDLRTISMTPRCRSGRNAEIYFGITRAFPAFYGVFLIPIFLTHFKGMVWADIAILAAMFAGILLPVFLVAIYKTKTKPAPTILLAEDIFATLDFAKPKWVDLKKNTKKRLKAISRNPPSSTEREMPSRMSYLNYFFYY